MGDKMRETNEKKTDIKNSPVAKKPTCTHKDIVTLDEESDRRYCAKGQDLHGAKCMSCNIGFGKEHNIPSITQPIYVYNNRTATGCIHVFYQDCYNTKMKNDGINNGNQQTRRKFN